MNTVELIKRKIRHRVARHNLAYYGKLYGSYDLDYEVLTAVSAIRMMKQDRATVLDIGANKGDYSARLASRLGDDVVIHCFEPSVDHKMTLIGLEKLNIGRIIFHPVGLSSAVGHKTLYKDRAGSGLASFYERNLVCHGLELSQSELIETTTVDFWCSLAGIETISFMKVDVEGHELDVFKGAHNMLSSGRINALQFEFGGCNLDSRTFLKDFYNLLVAEYGYQLYRLAPGKKLVDINRYRENLEYFSWQNIYAFKHASFISSDYIIIDEY